MGVIRRAFTDKNTRSVPNKEEGEGGGAGWRTVDPESRPQLFPAVAFPSSKDFAARECVLWGACAPSKVPRMCQPSLHLRAVAASAGAVVTSRGRRPVPASAQKAEPPCRRPPGWSTAVSRPSRWRPSRLSLAGPLCLLHLSVHNHAHRDAQEHQ